MANAGKTAFDRQRFIKVCGMMSSAHDGEALAALRKANAMLKESKLTWAEALQTTTTQATNGRATHHEYEYWPPPTSHRQRTPAQRWQHFVRDHPREAAWLTKNNDHNDFAASLVRGIYKFGSLTERQMAAVRRHL